jgi:hypothetical protein
LEAGHTLPGGNTQFPIKLAPKEVAAVNEESAALWVFGFLSYVDFLGDPHESRFCYKWVRSGAQPDGSLKPVGFVYAGETPSAYSCSS